MKRILNEVTENKSGWLGILILGAMAVGALYMSVIAVNSSLQVVGSAKWVKTPCTIVSASYKKSQRTRGSARSRRTKTVYTPTINYYYEYNGQTYFSDQFQIWANSFSQERLAQDFAALFPNGSKSYCFVNPAGPAEVVMRKNSSGLAWFALLPIAIFMASGSLFFVQLNTKIGLVAD